MLFLNLKIIQEHFYNFNFKKSYESAEEHVLLAMKSHVENPKLLGNKKKINKTFKQFAQNVKLIE